jgi:type I restriction enzyme S subunit
MKVFECVPVCELVSSGEAELKTGPFGTQLKASDYTKSGTPVINVRNIGLGGIKPDKLEYISNETRDRLASHILRSGDIVFGRKGAVERHVFVRKQQDGWFQGSDCLRLRFHGRRVEPLFASYFFLTPEHQRWMMNQCSHGATMASLNQGILERIELPLPPPPIQRRIAGILSAYDDLIENSQRRIKILEEMARRLYREWFVYFRFPGHEGCRLVQSPLGEIPEGWEVKALGQVAELNYGKALKKEERLDGPFPVFGSSGQVGTHVLSLTKGPGIVVGRKGNVGSVFWCDDDFFVIDTAYFVTSALPLRFLYYLFPSLNFINSDAAVPGLSRNQAYSLEIVVPPIGLLDSFCEQAEILEGQAGLLARQIQNLRRTRDLLLPRLLSGQIDVEVLPEPALSEP